MRQEMMGFWNILASAGPYANNDPIRTSLQTDNHTNTSSLNFYRPGALPDAQPTVSKQWQHQQSKHCTTDHDHDHHCYSEQANILSDKSGEESFAAAFHNVVQSSTDNNRTSTNKTFTQTTPLCVTLHSVYSLQPLVQPTVWPQPVVQPIARLCKV